MDPQPAARAVRPARWRRPARFVVLCLALGLLSTLAMAWVVPPLALRFGLVTHEGRWRNWEFSNESGFWTVQRSHIWLSDWYKIMQMMGGHGGPAERLPAWAQVPPFKSRWWQVDTAATGWPLRAMTSESWVDHGGQETLRNNVLLGTVARGRIFLPLGVLWGRLLGDVAIHSAAWAVLLIVPRVSRRAIRKSRGRCAACGYDVRGVAGAAGCPECGAAFM